MERPSAALASARVWNTVRQTNSDFPDQFGLHGLEEGLAPRIVITVSFPGHRDPDAVLPQLGLIRDRTRLTAA
jgi:hypothetical protein